MQQFIAFVIHHWVLWTLLGVILTAIFFNERLSQKNAPEALSPNAAVGLMNHQNAMVIDLRDKEAYRKGHIINAVRATEADFEKDKFQQDKQALMILVCASGLQSRTIAAKLKQQGFINVKVLSGGMAAWSDDGLPVIKGK